eukprot:7378398-Prymnesium_polylepis.1
MRPAGRPPMPAHVTQCSRPRHRPLACQPLRRKRVLAAPDLIALRPSALSGIAAKPQRMQAKTRAMKSRVGAGVLFSVSAAGRNRMFGTRKVLGTPLCPHSFPLGIVSTSLELAVVQCSRRVPVHFARNAGLCLPDPRFRLFLRI